LKHEGAKTIWVSVNAAPFPPRGVVTTYEDITERREAEVALQQVKERLQLATQAANIGIRDWEIEGNELKWDDAMYRIYGISREDFGDAYEAWTRFLHPDDALRVSEEIQKALRGEKEYATDFRILWPDGSIRVVQAESRTLRDRDGRPLRMVGVNLDITDRKQAEADRLVLGKLESTGILAGGIAHDFNYLLKAIMFGLDVARNNLSHSEDVEAILNSAEEATRTARGLATQLIALSDGGEAVRRPMRLQDLLNRIVKSALRGSLISSQVTTSSDLWSAEIDEGQIGHVFQNLIRNAREAMEAGGKVTVDAVNVVLSDDSQPFLPAGEYLCIRVKDEGEGIAPEVLTKVFDPYFSTKERGSQKGMGLGLTICHAVLKRHGGAITAESTVGQGATFSVYLPALRGSSREG